MGVVIEGLGSISPTFYEQLLRVQIPKAQKAALLDCLFFALLGTALVKTARRTLVKLTLGRVKLRVPTFFSEQIF